jgi:hypothetical protein
MCSAFTALAPTASRAEASPGPFAPDGCTSFTEGPPQQPRQWAHCCFEHDLRFWAGGSETSRDRADLRLRECVRETGADRTAELMYRAVRAARNLPIRNRAQRWGNAWAEVRPRYQPLSRDEADAVLRAAAALDLMPEVRARFEREIERELSPASRSR